jgi:hypothetical protein
VWLSGLPHVCATIGLIFILLCSIANKYQQEDTESEAAAVVKKARAAAEYDRWVQGKKHTAPSKDSEGKDQEHTAADKEKQEAVWREWRKNKDMQARREKKKHEKFFSSMAQEVEESDQQRVSKVAELKLKNAENRRRRKKEKRNNGIRLCSSTVDAVLTKVGPAKCGVDRRCCL